MLLQVTIFDVLDAWDAHVVLSEIAPTGRSWTQLGHDLVAGSAPDAPVSSQLLRVAAYLEVLAARYREIEDATRHRQLTRRD